MKQERLAGCRDKKSLRVIETLVPQQSRTAAGCRDKKSLRVIETYNPNARAVL